MNGECLGGDDNDNDGYQMSVQSLSIGTCRCRSGELSYNVGRGLNSRAACGGELAMEWNSLNLIAAMSVRRLYSVTTQRAVVKIWHEDVMSL